MRGSKEKPMKKHLTTVLLIGIFLIGFSLLLYPTFSNYWNSFHQSRAVASYVERVDDLQDDEYAAVLQQAHEYNRDLAEREQRFTLSDEEADRYKDTLDPIGNGIMGYVEIPSIGVNLPIYHSTDEAVLQKAVGHLDWTSLPTGGENTHCVISGHRGLPSAKLFTDIDKLVPGDIFRIHVLDEVLTYEVENIATVDPDDVWGLQIEQGRDLCTLVTCTPYGVNTHRLLIKAHRIETAEDTPTVRVTADAMQIDPLIIAPILASPILLVLLIVLCIKPTKKRNGV